MAAKEDRPSLVVSSQLGSLASEEVSMRAFDLSIGASLLVALSGCGAATGLDVDARIDGGAFVSDGGVIPPPQDASTTRPDTGVIDACAAPCTLGTSRCNGDGVETCILQSDGCASWSSAPCGAHHACTSSGGGAVCICSNAPECLQGSESCDASGTHVTCATDGDGCVYVSSKTTCALGCDGTTGQCVSVNELFAGYLHICAHATNETVACWGYDGFGQIGTGLPTNDALDPIVVPGLDHVATIGLGGFHTCAILTDGTTKCWGRNNNGQLGDGSNTDRATPVNVPGVTDATEIQGGMFHTCALGPSGNVTCWGWNASGQLGDGTTQDSVFPVDVIGVQNATQISIGAYHGCALLEDGDVMCWGQNNHGQLGNGTTQGSPFAARVPGLHNVSSLSIGPAALHVCAVLTNRELVCWGDNSSAALGDGTSVDAPKPIPIAGVHGLDMIAAGGDLTCVTAATGTACWGTGDFTMPATTVPVPIVGLEDAVVVAAGQSFACALRESDEEIDCWGGNLKGQLGNGSHAPSYVPAPVH